MSRNFRPKYSFSTKNYKLSTLFCNLIALIKKGYPMKNKRITHSREQVEIYKDYYRPSINLWRFAKSILGVLIMGSGSAAHHYIPVKKRKP
jgi:hypothetical protein